MFCKECGQYVGGAKFCTGCGERVRQGVCGQATQGVVESREADLDVWQDGVSESAEVNAQGQGMGVPKKETGGVLHYVTTAPQQAFGMGRVQESTAVSGKSKWVPWMVVLSVLAFVLLMTTIVGFSRGTGSLTRLDADTAYTGKIDTTQSLGVTIECYQTLKKSDIALVTVDWILISNSTTTDWVDFFADMDTLQVSGSVIRVSLSMKTGSGRNWNINTTQLSAHIWYR
ncbi:MAG: hypothetical protein FWD76_06365 [Firmicutes bacterium]|nr:hypothetical protein [Bacillota bacterium]